METTLPPPATVGAPLRFGEFVLLVASLMALVALGIDSMLPALPAIGRSLNVADPNQRQYVITAFVSGFGVAQLFHGPLADRFGRRRVLMVALACYVVANALAAVSASFALLLAARVTGGVAIAASRVATVAIVRDCYAGRAMARVMSIAFMVFMAVPVVAPTFGQAVLLIGHWRDIFWAVAIAAALVLGWFAARMPETLARPLPIRPAIIVANWRRVASDRLSLGYTLATASLLGALYGYLNSIEQIMADVFGRPALLSGLFAGTAATMAAANLANARLVMRLGQRALGHGALAAMLLLSLAHLALIEAGAETIARFAVFQALTMGCFGLASSNFSSLAMTDMGPVAGTAAAVQGAASVSIGAIIGVAIGQAFDGSPAPLACGFAVASAVALALVGWTERWRLFSAG